MYKSGLRVYLFFLLMAIVGVLAGMKLPVSLYPNSSKPTVFVDVQLAGMSPESFYEAYGLTFESSFRKLEKNGITIDQLISEFDNNGVSFQVIFDWEISNELAVSEVEKVVANLKATMSQELADGISVSQWNRSSGFFALSFFSAKRSADEVFEITNTIFSPLLSSVQDAESASIWNPNHKEVIIELDQVKLARYGLLPRHIQSQIKSGLASYNAGSVKNGNNSLSIKIDNNQETLEKLNNLVIQTAKSSVYLSQIATIKFEVSENQQRIFKTNGSTSLILFASPKGGGNVKKMSEDILQIVEENESRLPKDIKYRVLVDPSEFIRSSLNNLFHEIAIAAILAVLILFLFIGDIKNVVTSAIEIPLSMVVAFIFMKIFGVNFNLISLGGLALAAGMNVDASVVVLENILRKLRVRSKNGLLALSFHDKLNTIQEAVKEVAAPVIVSMITTLVVFIPIAFTSKLTNAVLGDLAKAVIYSHCFSAIVALVLVPTIRFHIISKSKTLVFPKAPLDRALKVIDRVYDRTLCYFFERKKIILSCLGMVFVTLAMLANFVIPTLPKEIIGRPDSDWVFVHVNAPTSTHIKEMENKISSLENEVMTKYKSLFRYTFVQIFGESKGMVMFRLIDKHDSSKALKMLQDRFKNTPDTYFYVDMWNPASLPLPEERELKIKITGRDFEKMLVAADKLKSDIQEKKFYDRVWSSPKSSLNEVVQYIPYSQTWSELQRSGADLYLSDVVDMARVSQGEKNIGQVVINNQTSNIFLSYNQSDLGSMAGLKSLPLNVKGKIIPLAALGEVSTQKEKPPIYRENSESVVIIHASLDKSDTRKYQEINKNIEKELLAPRKDELIKDKISASMEDPKIELSDALKQLISALILSLLLILFALIMQFGNLISPFIVMLAIPLGLIGVFSSLYIFNSNLSLNSVLGMILLNGIAVNNSILLVEFSNNLFKEGSTAYNAVLEASRKRLRPILITSLTTILGMFPIAIGMGEGGKILSPLGIAVSGGLWVSTFLTIFLIPMVQYLYLSWSEKKRQNFELGANDEALPLDINNQTTAAIEEVEVVQ